MLLPDRNLPPPGSPPPKDARELVDAIQRFGILATDARQAEIARIIQGVVYVASRVDDQQAQRHLELESRVAELERSIVDALDRAERAACEGCRNARSMSGMKCAIHGTTMTSPAELVVDGMPESHA